MAWSFTNPLGTDVGLGYYEINGGMAELYSPAFGPDTSSILVTATADGYTDYSRITRVTDGISGSSFEAYLTQPSYVTPASSSGKVDS